MNNAFCIGVSVEMVATSFEFAPQLEKIVDFTVENDPDALVFVVNGLSAAGKVDDTEAAHAQAGRALDVNAFIVRTTVHDSLAHSANLGRIDRLACAPHHSR